MTINITVGRGSGWPNGKPVASEALADGRTKHTMESGMVFTIPPEPNYLIRYLSTWADTEEGETYDVRICLTGRSIRAGFYEVWNYDIGEIRNYRFDKTVEVVELETGKVFPGAELEAGITRALPSK